MTSNVSRIQMTGAAWRLLALPGLLVVAGLCAGCPGEGSSDDRFDDQLACAEPLEDAIRFPETKLYFEHNSTDEDTGLHGLLDATGWSRLCVYDPNGEQILAVKPLGKFGDLGMASLFFESREPTDDAVSLEEHLANYPAGSYEIRGLSWDGKGLTGDAMLTHDLPRGPVITSPASGAVVPPVGLVVTWEPVTETISGGAIEISGYEVIVTDEEAEDPHGFAQPIFDVHVPASLTSMTVPDEFLRPGRVYEIEVLALEVSGNQTITEIFFETE